MKIVSKLKRDVILPIINLKYRKNIKKLKNSFLGKRCFIIGNGPSLQVSDLNMIKNEISFGTHGIYNIFNKTEWRPNFYVAQDFKLIENKMDDIMNNTDNIDYRFFPVNILRKYPKKVKKSKNTIFFNLKVEEFYPNLPKFSECVEKNIYEGMTVTYACIQFAVYMGFKEIYLLGVDHNYSIVKKPDGSIVSSNVKDYFEGSEKFDQNKLNLPQTDKSTLAYKKAYEYCKDNNIKIFNATRGGKLEIFERVTLEDIL